MSFADDVRRGLDAGVKRIPSKYLYDDLGSTLFEAICLLPEYGLTRADERILEAHAAAIVERMCSEPGPGGRPATLAVAELGSGTGRKTRHVLEAVAARRSVRYFPIDLSRAALLRCRVELSGVAGALVEPIEADYLDGLSRLAARRRGERLLVLFLGSTIGNFEPAEARAFLRAVRGFLAPGDGLLLGADLQQDRAALLAAYDDALGVTAAFDLNLLVRINRELDGGFDPRRFAHRARWDAGARRVEMHLEARGAQRVRVAGAGIEACFRDGETVWTESSHKYLPGEPAAIGEECGYQPAGAWLDDAWPFAETLLVVGGASR